MSMRREKICLTFLESLPLEDQKKIVRGMFRNRLLNRLDSLLDKKRVEAGAELIRQVNANSS